MSPAPASFLSLSLPKRSLHVLLIFEMLLTLFSYSKWRIARLKGYARTSLDRVKDLRLQYKASENGNSYTGTIEPANFIMIDSYSNDCNI